MTRPGRPRRCTATSPRRCSMARKRASMREGPLAELFRATEAAQRQADDQAAPPAEAAREPDESTVEHVPTWEEQAKPASVTPLPAKEPAKEQPARRPRRRAPEPRPVERYLEP